MIKREHKSGNVIYKESRYVYARQMKRDKRCIKNTETDLGQVVRDIEHRPICPKIFPLYRHHFTQSIRKKGDFDTL